MTVSALTVGPGVLLQRIAMRDEGLGPALPGDVLRGRSRTELDAVAERAVARLDAIRTSGVASHVVETDGLSVSDVADRVIVRAFAPG